MLIHEICKECDVTKKAVEYYEKQGLINPKINNNNYRYYDRNDVLLLKEIAMLRKLNVSIQDIKIIISSDNKLKALSDYKVKKELQMEKMKAQYDCLNYLLKSGYNIEETSNIISHKLDEHIIIKDKLIQVFPGTYGMYLNLHFGKFLNEKIDSHEKEIAYSKIVKFLDTVEFPEELEQFLTNALAEVDLEKIDGFSNMFMGDFGSFINENSDTIEQYLAYRNSEEFKSSTAYKMQQKLIVFQNSIGYYDIFIANLKILSSSYRKFQERLELANKEFLNIYPEAKNIHS
ncbi:DNA-binding transcriptional MerR regulator [Anaerosolibacter carboniphilus]|uniref:DNA-binding transcriptional MerR regulator n=1 Tax=Anaerosolibacter carboniphilus TaxID=1417629 RepID=A0A841L1U1_9FIRM|nr:MerR family transcriptional regulator [Anaerosolibacter carboniphilus]MBB6216325.1 DNA-binding transcriptional MerR regulator [Anaerosolibacter carboniphilus]